MIISLIISVLCSMGITVLFVEKGNKFPVKYIRILLSKYLHKIHYKIPQVFSCSVCLCFWTTLISDLMVYFILGNYFLFPISGFITVFIVWFIYEILNIMDFIGKAIYYKGEPK